MMSKWVLDLGLHPPSTSPSTSTWIWTWTEEVTHAEMPVGEAEEGGGLVDARMPWLQWTPLAVPATN